MWNNNQNVNEKIHEEGLLEECEEDPFYNMLFICMHSFL